VTHKETRKAEIKGCGSGGSSANGFLDLVTMQLEITDVKDTGRPVQALMTPDKARHWAALLTRMADLVDARHKPAGLTEAEAETHVTANGDSHTHLSTNGGTHTVCGKTAAGLAKTVSFSCPDCQYLMQRR
jgi:hypothetical protein